MIHSSTLGIRKQTRKVTVYSYRVTDSQSQSHFQGKGNKSRVLFGLVLFGTSYH